MIRRLAAFLTLTLLPVAACGDSTGPERLFGFDALVGDWHADAYDVTNLENRATFRFAEPADATILDDSTFTLVAELPDIAGGGTATIAGRIISVDETTLVGTGSFGGLSDTLTAVYIRTGSTLDLRIRGLSFQLDLDPELEPAEVHALFAQSP